MKRAIFAGIVGGVVYGIISSALISIGLNMKIPFLVMSGLYSLSTPAQLVLGIVYGIIFGALYAYFYDYIPSKGVRKGLIFGLIIWTTANIRVASLFAAHNYIMWLTRATAYIFVGFLSVCIPYGLVLGVLYRKLSD